MSRRRTHFKCSLWWCDSLPYAGGMCQKHYMRYWRNQTALRKDDEISILLKEIEIAHSLLSDFVELANEKKGEESMEELCRDSRAWIERTKTQEGVLDVYDIRSM